MTAPDDPKPDADPVSRDPIPPPTEEQPPPRAPYVFKIVPADPKNSLAFEDMADK